MKSILFLVALILSTLIALRQPNRAAILSRLEWALSTIAESDFPNRVFQLRDKT